MFRAVTTALALALGAAPASAQITTYIPPARPDTLREQAIAAADSIKRDSTGRAALSDMKAWVDSAAGVSVPGPFDTAAPTVEIEPVQPVQPVTTFENGMAAPATASEVPAIALLGALALVAGAALLARRPRH